jgi:ribosome assembly protein YihI (activator of Der GTPase)
MANIVVSALSTFNNKGLKKGKKEISAFEKQVKNFGRTFAAAFSVTALTRFSREAVKAFAADEKAAKALEIQLRNTGYQFSAPGVELYIDNLQRATGVLDDELRPAFQQLLTVTGSITKSQDALNTAMDVSAATGRSLTQVTTALSRAYAGNTTGLSRLGAGLDKNLLKAGNMDDIMAELNNKFSGQAAARLDTYAGKLSLISVAAANSQEIIGKGLLDALSALGKDNSIASVTNSMEDFATATSEVLVGLGKVAGKLKEITNVPGIDGSFLRNIPGIGAVLRATEALRGAGRQETDRGGQERTAGRVNAQQRRQETQAIKNAVTLRKAEIDQLKKKSAVDQLKDKFDLERIGLTVALNEATDKETKLRIQAQLAILDNNEALAKKILAEMNAAKATEEMIAALRAFVRATLDSIEPQMNALRMLIGLNEQNLQNKKTFVSPTTPLAPAIPALPASYFQDLGTRLEGSPNYAGMTAAEISMERLRESGNRPVNLTLTVDTANSGDRFSQLIAESIQLASRSGYGTTPAGSLP